MTITKETVEEYASYLRTKRRAEATIQKYVYHIQCFVDWLGERAFNRESFALWTAALTTAPRTINGAISAINGFASWLGHSEIRLEFNKVETPYYRPESRDLKKSDYNRLLDTAERLHLERLHLVIMTIAGMGIRVSELRFVTVEALDNGTADITNKGKTRPVPIPGKLRKRLIHYCRKNEIESGSVFLTRNRRELSRGQIWRELKELARKAGVELKKVFPHNLRHLFAVLHYKAHRDIFGLSRLLGHSSVKTTQIYLAESSLVFERGMERLGLIR